MKANCSRGENALELDCRGLSGHLQQTFDSSAGIVSALVGPGPGTNQYPLILGPCRAPPEQHSSMVTVKMICQQTEHRCMPSCSCVLQCRCCGTRFRARRSAASLHLAGSAQAQYETLMVMVKHRLSTSLVQRHIRSLPHQGRLPTSCSESWRHRGAGVNEIV